MVPNSVAKSPKGINPCHKHFSNRLKQTLAVLFALWTLIVAPFCILSVLLLFGFYTLLWLDLIFTIGYDEDNKYINLSIRPFAGLYLVWYIYDYKQACRGSRPSEYVQNWPLWRYMADYFPVEIHKTAEIPPTNNYIFSAHPHGILGSSSMLLFSSNSHNTQKLFPGIKLHGATLGVNFWFPIRRELFMALGGFILWIKKQILKIFLNHTGIISCNPESISYVLSRTEKGNAVGIVPGGAAESLESHPTIHRLILKNRKNIIKRWTSVAFPFAYGQNFLASFLPVNYIHKLPRLFTIGLLPFRHKVITVVGAPIPIKKNENPSDDLVDSVHAEYCLRLREMFNQYKTQLGGLPKDAELQFL
uniref:Acyltransferase n=1 Tax=Meloidogyne hapla TaxID=6305 RepID=A0A1I8BX40_MELHA